MTTADEQAAGPTDRELLAAHVAGDDEAFGTLFRRHRDRLWAVALRTLGDPDDAADALQDGMINAYRRAASYRGDAAVTTWLHRVVVNACLDRVRRQAVRAADPLLDDDLPGALPVGATPAGLDAVEAHVVAWDVQAALATLPAEQRAALVLVDMGGWSVDEAAAILEVAPGTVKSRCARGRARLLPMLSPAYGSAHARSGSSAPTPNAPTTTAATETASGGPAPTGAVGRGTGANDANRAVRNPDDAARVPPSTGGEQP